MNNKKNVIWNAIGSTASAANSLFFTIAATRINGVDQAGVFSYAFANACIFYVIGTYIIRTFQVTDNRGVFTDSDYLYNRIISCVVIMLAAFIFVITNKYDVYKSAVIIALCLFKCFEAFAEVFYGVIQKNNCLYKVGRSLFIKAIVEVTVFIVIDYITKNLLYSSLSVAIVCLLLTLFIDLPNYNNSKTTESPFVLKTIFYLFKSGFFAFVITVLGLYLINSPRYAIDSFLDNKSQTVYGIIIMPATVMCLLGQYIIHPYLTSISKYVLEKNYDKLKSIITNIIVLMFALGVVVCTVAFFFEEPVLSLIYNVNLKSYKTDMFLIMIGAIMYGLETILSYILIAFRKIVSQSIIFVVVSVLALVTSRLLVSKKGLFGASITYLMIMAAMVTALFVNLIIYMSAFKKKCKTIGDKQ